jgi:large subunit ribosomal protein L15
MLNRLNSLVRLLKKRKRVARGGSRGGTSGAGHKGQRARAGDSLRSNFEGGQMPLTRRVPKRGFKNGAFKNLYKEVNLGDILLHAQDGAKIDRDFLISTGIVKRSCKLPIKILADLGSLDSLDKKLFIYADAFSKAAYDKVKSLSGDIIVGNSKKLR